VEQFRNADKIFHGHKANSLDPRFAKFAIISKHLPASADLCVHEIGHLLGLRHTFVDGHPGSEKRAPEDAAMRIMSYDERGHRVNKAERDIIHAQLREIIDNGTP
jgi:hypothetical protein